MTAFLGNRCRCCEYCTAPCAGVRAHQACDDGVCTCTDEARARRKELHRHYQGKLADRDRRTCRILEMIAQALDHGVDPASVAAIARGAAVAIRRPAEKQAIQDAVLAEVERLEREKTTETA